MEETAAREGYGLYCADMDARNPELTYHTLKAAIANAHMPTAHHSIRVRICASLLGQACSLDGRRMTTLAIAAEIHDIGKLYISPGLLDKRDMLSQEDWAILRKHPMLGAKIAAAAFPLMPDVAECVLCHHERVDGSGYPQALKSDQFSLEAKIIAVADVFVALLEERPYRRAYSPDQALSILIKDDGIKYDNIVVSAAQSLRGSLTDFGA
ncbi:MAG: HD domain-containing phosphohydrolase [Armatimonadota bacterium]